MKKRMSTALMLALLLTNMTGAYAESSYTVQSGDVLWKIAENHNMQWRTLARDNNLENPNRIYPGQVLQVKGEMEMTNAQKVEALLKSIETGAQEPVGYINPEKYIQHNLGVADGLAGFGALLSQLPKGSAKVNTVRVFEDGDYVFAHTDYDFFGPKVGFDVFRFEEGKIVEHWDNLTEKSSEPNPSGRRQVDGQTALADIEKTQDNKALVSQFVNDILVNGKMEKLGQYFDGDNYIQHNTAIADGLSGLGTALEAMAKQGLTMRYDTVHKVLGQGNFVLVMSEGEFAGNHVAFYDMFRVENGLIAEHWDVIEEIPEEENWMNANGKF